MKAITNADLVNMNFFVWTLPFLFSINLYFYFEKLYS